MEDLSFSASDEGGRPVVAGVSGRMMCGWMRKSRSAHFAEEGTMVLLPKLNVTNEVLPPRHWLVCLTCTVQGYW